MDWIEEEKTIETQSIKSELDELYCSEAEEIPHEENERYR